MMDADQFLRKRILPNTEALSWKAIDDEIIFLLKAEKSFYEMNKSATLVWAAAIDKKSVGEIISILQKKYPKVGKDALKKDVYSFIQSMLDKGIISLY